MSEALAAYWWVRVLPWWQALLLHFVVWDFVAAAFHARTRNWPKGTEEVKRGTMIGMVLYLPVAIVYLVVAFSVGFAAGLNIVEQLLGVAVGWA